MSVNERGQATGRADDGSNRTFRSQLDAFVARGPYTLRHEASAEGYDAPTAFVAPASGFESMIEIIGAPGAPNGRLEGPGAVLLVRASDNASLRVGVKRKSTGRSLEAALKLESVGGLLPSPPRLASLHADGTATRTTAVPGEAASGILFVAHVARRGNVSVRAGEWAAGPDAPAKIEGLELWHPVLDDVGLEVQVLSADPSGIWSRWAKPGAFIGTLRGLPLVGLRRLTGETTRRYTINADALFLGSAIANRRGREVEFLPSARDPLVGFRLDLRPERRRLAEGAAGRNRRRASRSSLQSCGGVTAASRSA